MSDRKVITNDCDLSSIETTDMSCENNQPQRQYITARRRSLSGSAVGTKSAHRKINFVLKNEKSKFKTNGQVHSLKNRQHEYDSTDCIHSDMENVSRHSPDSNSISTHSSREYHKSNSVLFTNSHRTSVSAKTKIKHFLAEHIVKTHPCHHPEYHFHKKTSDISDFQEVDFPDQNSYASSNSSSPKELSSPRLKTSIDNQTSNNYTSMASTVLDRIRHMNIQSVNPSHRISVDQVSVKLQSLKDLELSEDANDTNEYFPSPEPNPYKLPKVTSPSSIMFSSKLIASHKSKRHRLAHSVSLDPDYKIFDGCKFSSERDKWERKISGYLDTSTSTGAALTAINFGLKRVTETEKYVMITKSPISSPNEFLEEGINHLQDSKALYRSLLQHTNCYDLMPDSGKIVIIDSQMQIGKAFEAIEDHIVRASPIWSSEKQEFITLLTVNDLIPLLLHFYKLQKENHNNQESAFSLEDFSTVTVEKILDVIPRFHTMQGHIAGVLPETNLYSVTNMLNQIRKSKVIVLDECLSGNPLFILTDLRILIYLSMKLCTMNVESCFNFSIRSGDLLSESHLEILSPQSNEECHEDLNNSLKIGKTQYLVYQHSPITDILRALDQSYYTCALILSSESKEKNQSSQFVISDVITISDILHLIMIHRHRDPTITAAQILQLRNQVNCPMTYRDPVVSCSIDQSIQYLIDIVVKEKASFALIRTGMCISSPTIGVLTPIDILDYISKQSSSANFLPNNSSIISDLHKIKRPSMKLFHLSDSVHSNKNSPKVLDDTLEEIFNIDFY